MKTRTEIDELKQNWLDKIKEYDQQFGRLKDSVEKNNNSVNNESSELMKECDRLWKELEQSLLDYHNACLDCLQDILNRIDDPLLKEFVKRVFDRLCYNTNDWDKALGFLDVWR